MPPSPAQPCHLPGRRDGRGWSRGLRTKWVDSNGPARPGLGVAAGARSTLGGPQESWVRISFADPRQKTILTLSCKVRNQAALFPRVAATLASWQNLLQRQVNFERARFMVFSSSKSCFVFPIAFHQICVCVRCHIPFASIYNMD